MSRSLFALLVVLFVASCGGSSYNSAPRNLDNACTILQQRPEYARAFKATERRWNVPVHVQMATIYQESKFVGNARTPFRYVAGVIPMGRLSSAYGYSQALDGTWEEYQAATGKRSAKRNRIKDASDFMGWYMNESKRRNGIPLSDARRQYLAYHEGHSGYARRTYNRKSWLVRVSSEVGQRSTMYRSQLRGCRALR